MSGTNPRGATGAPGVGGPENARKCRDRPVPPPHSGFQRFLKVISTHGDECCVASVPGAVPPGDLWQSFHCSTPTRKLHAWRGRSTPRTLLIVAELVVHQRMRPVARQF